MKELDQDTHNGLVRLIESYHKHIEGTTKNMMKEKLKDILRNLRADGYLILEYWQKADLPDSDYFALQRKGKLYERQQFKGD